MLTIVLLLFGRPDQVEDDCNIVQRWDRHGVVAGVVVIVAASASFLRGEIAARGDGAII
jgi:hypothetical protein